MYFPPLTLSLTAAIQLINTAAAAPAECRTQNKTIQINGSPWKEYCNTAIVNGTYSEPRHALLTVKACYTHCNDREPDLVAAVSFMGGKVFYCRCFTALGSNATLFEPLHYAGFPEVS